MPNGLAWGGPLFPDSNVVYSSFSFASAGVGRTGVFCALSILIERLKSEGVVDVFQTVKQLRAQRPAMVQTKVCPFCEQHSLRLGFCFVFVVAGRGEKMNAWSHVTSNKLFVILIGCWHVPIKIVHLRVILARGKLPTLLFASRLSPSTFWLCNVGCGLNHSL